jgi:hypothetical protein
MKRTPLKRKTPLKRTSLKSFLRMVSKKQAVKNASWRKVTLERKKLIKDRFGVLLCEHCGRPEYAHEIRGWPFDGHHIDGNRNNNTPENCAVVYRTCHSFVTDHNIKVAQINLENVIKTTQKSIDIA